MPAAANILKRLRDIHLELMAARKVEDELEDERPLLVRWALEEGCSPPEVARAAGLSEFDLWEICSAVLEQQPGSAPEG